MWGGSCSNWMIALQQSKDIASTAEAQAHETLEKMSKLWELVVGLSPTVVGKRVRMMWFVDVKLIRARSAITAGLSESGAAVVETIWDRHDGLVGKGS